MCDFSSGQSVINNVSFMSSIIHFQTFTFHLRLYLSSLTQLFWLSINQSAFQRRLEDRQTHARTRTHIYCMYMQHINNLLIYAYIYTVYWQLATAFNVSDVYLGVSVWWLMPWKATVSVRAEPVRQKVVDLVLCSPLALHSHRRPDAEGAGKHQRTTRESKTPDKARPHSARVKNKHEECQCLWGRERRLKIYIYSESVRDQTAKLIRSSFKPCAAAFPQFPHLATYRLSTSAIAMKTPGWPAVTSPWARVPATRRKGLVRLPRAKMWARFTHDPSVLAHEKT